MKIIIVRIGNKYGPEYETYLESKLTDYEIVWIKEPIQEDIWYQWNKMAAMNLDIDEPVCVMDIDILLVNDYKEVFEYPIEHGQFLAMPSWWGGALKADYKINGGFFKYYPKDCKYIYKAFMMDPRHWQSWYIKNGTTIGPVNGEQYFVEDFVNKRLELITFPDSWVTRWCDEGVEWQTNITKKYNKQTGNDYVYLGGEFHPDIKMVHFTRPENKPHDWIDYHSFL
jgi:hypothetical protein|tara:strand:- start:6103 stop:6780 length:678 start_codon:yes stop_codon:yes gene_type:complete